MDEVKNKKNNWFSKIDKIVTWVIVWWALASIFWLAHTKKWKEITQEVKNKVVNSAEKSYWWTKNILWKTLWYFWKTLAFFVWIFNKK